ncbi:glycosyltransferase family 4 protein [Aequorivita sp. SDUM287046]|uniref:Glycosyltransferase family 4 protein n=1 Tax=Aequorivita aurantiaca TaxID=3053356 RepID=A0ABT8DKD2_9FLAO|nr:glycosyltransferase family 4 protein [Aequorivita aurantiaca]MDN3725289.1 glycosyltransferase family 4 protein [Aequorivita aurantiaca]
MKLNLKIRSFPNPTETFIVHHILGLLKQGVKIKIYTNAYHGMATFVHTDEIIDSQIDKLVHKNLKVKKGMSKIFQVLGLVTKPRILKYAVKYYIVKPQWSLKPLYNLYNYRDFDISLMCHIQFNTSIKPLIDLWAIGFINPKKILITFHGYDAFRLNEEVFKSRYSEFYKSCVYAVTVNSNYVKQYLVKAGLMEEMIKIIPMGIDVSMFNDLQAKPKQDTIIKLVSVGRLIQLKGHKYGMQVLKILLDRGYEATYTIIGKGLDAYTNELKKEVKRLGIGEYIFFMGQKSQKDIKDILFESSIFLMTSTFDDLTGRQEAFGIAALEAQACGLPVIAFKSGGVPEVIVDGETGFLVEDRNVLEMANKVELLYNDSTLYHAMGIKAREHALVNFDNDKLIRQFIKLYHLND